MDEGVLRWRSDKDIPPASILISSPVSNLGRRIAWLVLAAANVPLLSTIRVNLWYVRKRNLQRFKVPVIANKPKSSKPLCYPSGNWRDDFSGSSCLRLTAKSLYWTFKDAFTAYHYSYSDELFSSPFLAHGCSTGWNSSITLCGSCPLGLSPTGSKYESHPIMHLCLYLRHRVDLTHADCRTYYVIG